MKFNPILFDLLTAQCLLNFILRVNNIYKWLYNYWRLAATTSYKEAQQLWHHILVMRYCNMMHSRAIAKNFIWDREAGIGPADLANAGPKFNRN